MKTFLATALTLAIVALPASAAQAGDPMEDICRVRAEKGSGFKGDRTGLTKQVGNTQFRLSGSVAVGASRSSGPNAGYGAPAFAGQAASDQREAKAKSKFTRIYNDCMRTR
jgi:hypothetical protein